MLAMEALSRRWFEGAVMTEAPGGASSPELEPFKHPPEHVWSEGVQAELDEQDQNAGGNEPA